MKEHGIITGVAILFDNWLYGPNPREQGWYVSYLQ